MPKEKPEIIKAAEKEVETTEQYYARGLLSIDEKKNKVIEIWSRTKSRIEELVPKTLPPTGSVFQMIDAGARGSWSMPTSGSG